MMGGAASFNAKTVSSPHRVVIFINVVGYGTRTSMSMRQNSRREIESDTSRHKGLVPQPVADIEIHHPQVRLHRQTRPAGQRIEVRPERAKKASSSSQASTRSSSTGSRRHTSGNTDSPQRRLKFPRPLACRVTVAPVARLTRGRAYRRTVAPAPLANPDAERPESVLRWPVTTLKSREGAPVRSRTKGMWWGTAIEAPDPGALARFYSELLSWPIGHEEPGTTILAAPEGSIYIVFQQATGYQAPVWPPVDGQQRPMMHFDFQVGDLESAVADAVALGALVAPDQPQPNVRVLFDPAGHPFCLCREED
jgi:predicted enzyme related to lactoylglutathione lyase